MRKFKRKFSVKIFIQKIKQFFVNYDVFISVENRDLNYAHRIRKFLRKYGARVFIYDSIEGGKKGNDKIKENLQDCSWFIALLSSNSLKSANVQFEIGGAVFNDKDYLPVLLEEIDTNKLGMMKEFQYVKFHDKSFWPHLRKKMFKIYLKRIILWLIIIAAIVYLKFFKNTT